MYAGQRCTKGYGKNTYGTGCFLLVHTGAEAVQSTAGLLTTVGYKLGSSAAATFALEGSVAIAGMAVAWLRDQLGIIDSAAEVEALAEGVPDTGVLCRLCLFVMLLRCHDGRTPAAPVCTTSVLTRILLELRNVHGTECCRVSSLHTCSERLRACDAVEC